MARLHDHASETGMSGDTRHPKASLGRHAVGIEGTQAAQKIDSVGPTLSRRLVEEGNVGRVGDAALGKVEDEV